MTTSGPAKPGLPPSDAQPLWRKAVLTYASLLVISGLAFGLIHAATSGSMHDWWLHGLIFGIVMSAVLGTTVVRGQRGNTGSWSPRQSATIYVPADTATARRQALAGLDQLQATVTTDEPSRLSARTGVSWKTWGTRIDITFDDARRAGSAHGAGPRPIGTEVQLRVRPRVRWTLIDYGIANRAINTLTYYFTPVDQQ